jgi:hypothetical protein
MVAADRVIPPMLTGDRRSANEIHALGSEMSNRACP